MVGTPSPSRGGRAVEPGLGCLCMALPATPAACAGGNRKPHPLLLNFLSPFEKNRTIRPYVPPREWERRLREDCR